ncbi:MAG: MBL fold metallo-hydrolase [Candidatus Hermodarchaeota archaeon]
MKIRVLKLGSICVEAFEPDIAYLEKLRYGLTCASNAILISIDDEHLLVDTSFENESDTSAENTLRNHENLRTNLEEFGLTPSDITKVYISHWHRDHFGNLDLFPDTEIFTGQLAARRQHYPRRLHGIREGKEVINGSDIRVLNTPGHTIDHTSLVIYSNEKTIVIAGDAITSLSYYLMGTVWNLNADFYDEDIAKESVRKITNIADLIFPGHGPPFYNQRELTITLSKTTKLSSKRRKNNGRI